MQLLQEIEKFPIEMGVFSRPSNHNPLAS